MHGGWIDSAHSSSETILIDIDAMSVQQLPQSNVVRNHHAALKLNDFIYILEEKCITLRWHRAKDII